MSCEDNPFATILGVMREEGGGVGLQLLEGHVTNLAPLTIEVGGLILSGDALRVNAHLIRHKIEDIEGSLDATVNCPEGSISKLTASGGELEITPDLKIGDALCLLTSDEQLFYALCKVVTP